MKINLTIPTGIKYPSIAVIPFAEGKVTSEEIKNQWQLFEESKLSNIQVHSFKEIVALWPGGSVKWVHVHGIFEGGVQYLFTRIRGKAKAFTPMAIPPDTSLNWEIQVEEGGIVWRNNASDRRALQIVPDEAYKLNLIGDTGGWKYIKPDGTEYEETKFEEVNNNFLRITRYEGWLKSPGQASTLFRYLTRVTRYASHPLIKISHAVIFAGNMRGKKIKHISFVINNPMPTPTSASIGVDGVGHNLILQSVQDSVSVHQRRIDMCEVAVPGGSPQVAQKSDGYIVKDNTTVLVRDFWQKFPQALECNSKRTTYRQWFGGNSPIPTFDQLIITDGVPVKERLLDQNLHKLYHWHQGPFLENNIPKTNNPDNPEWADKYYTDLKKEEGAIDEYSDYTDRADMQGISIHDDIGIYQGNMEPRTMANIWNNNPVGSCDPGDIEITKVSDFGARGTDFKKVEEFLENSILSYTDPKRFEDYGRFLYGESHRNIFPYLNRPSRHRIGVSSYYSAGETYWRMRLRGGSDEILKLARRNTERYRSIVQVSYDKLACIKFPNSPETYWHNPGGFWHRGLWWGSSDPDRRPEEGHVALPMEYQGGHGAWNQLDFRIPDPDSLLWSWIIDGNRYHREGYDLWYKNAKNRIQGIIGGSVNSLAGTARNLNKMLVYSITAYEYYLKHPVLNYTVDDISADLSIPIQDLGQNLMTVPLNTAGIDGPLWHPEWIRRYVDYLVRHYQGTEAEKQVLVSEALKFCIENYNSNFHDDQKTIDMATLLIDITLGKYDNYTTPPMVDIRIKDQLVWISRIIEKVYKGMEEDGKWYDFGVGDGELGDAFLKLQWGAFVKRLRLLNVTGKLPQYDYPGHYPSSVQYYGGGKHFPLTPFYSRGNEYLILKTGNAPLEIKFRFNISHFTNFSFKEIWLISQNLREENLLNPGNINWKTTRFISVIKKIELSDHSFPPDTLEDHYPLDNGQFINLNDHTLNNSAGNPTVFESFSPPYNIERTKTSWESSNSFFYKEGANEKYTFRDSVAIEPGIVSVIMSGRSVYPGLTVKNAPEAMLLTNYDSDDRSNNHGNYLFKDSRFYYKNPDNLPVTITLWASVFQAVVETGSKISRGTFARVEEMDPFTPTVTIETYNLRYSGLGYGDQDTKISILIPAGKVALLKTVLIYNTTIIRAKLSGRLLCAKSMADLTALENAMVNR